MDRDLQHQNEPGSEPMGRPAGDEVITGATPGRSIESGRTEVPDAEIEMGDERSSPGGYQPSL